MAELKDKFMNHTQALIHGDLHTGSIMVTQDKTVMIDPEFAFFGPIGFDTGAILANFFLAYFAQGGLETQDKEPKNRQEYKKWLAATAIQIWEGFVDEFIGLWNTKSLASGADGYNLSQQAEEVKQLQKSFISNVFIDTLGFTAAKMIRRIIGIAHVADLESIQDLEVRSRCEVKVLNFAKKLAKDRKKGAYASIKDVVAELAQ